MVQINYLAAFVAAILHFSLGWLWYGKLFCNAWMTSIGMTQEQCEAAKQKGMAKAMIICFICCVFLALSTVHFVALVNAQSIPMALQQLICPALGFVLAPIAMGIEYENRKWTYFLITGGYIVAGMIIAGIATFLL